MSLPRLTWNTKHINGTDDNVCAHQDRPVEGGPMDGEVVSWGCKGDTRLVYFAAGEWHAANYGATIEPCLVIVRYRFDYARDAWREDWMLSQSQYSAKETE